MKQRHVAAVFALLAAVSTLVPDGQRRLARGHRLVDTRGQGALEAMRFEEPRTLLGGQIVGETQGARVLIGGFPVGAEARGPPGGVGRVAQGRRRIADSLGVVRQPSRIAVLVRRCLKTLEHLAMQCPPREGGDGAQDRLARQLVAEGDPPIVGFEDAAFQTGVEILGRRGGDVVEQNPIDGGADRGCRGEHRGNEKRIPGRARVEHLRVHVALGREIGYALGR